jgi:hypothetical protein
MNNNDPIRSFGRGTQYNRRSFLRGLGVCLALPSFESLRPFSGLAENSSAARRLAQTATGAPLRTAFLYFPNGAIPSAWWPASDGNEFTFSPTLKALDSVRSQIQILGGLDHQNAAPGMDGAGDHARGNSVFLTGVRLNKSATDIRAGISIDQAIAREVGHLTRFPSLELTCDSVRQTAACDSGYSCAYQFNISWSSPSTPMTPECNPRLVFERLFGPGSHGERNQAAQVRQQQQQSVLDFVMEETRSMQKNLTARDKDKLDEYLTSVRQVEARIQKSESFGPARDPDRETPTGIPPDYAEYLQTMMDLLVLAFQTDSTRVATLLLAHDGSNRSFSDIGISEGHHDLSHHQDKEDRIQKVAQIDAWYAKQFAKFLEKLQNTKDVDGNSLLRNSMIVYGGGNADGNRHTHSNLPIVLAGTGGGALTTGRFVKHGGKPMTNLFLTMADQMGCTRLDRFGDSTGRLAGV